MTGPVTNLTIHNHPPESRASTSQSQGSKGKAAVFSGGKERTQMGGEHGEMPDKVQRFREKLKARYIKEFSEVKVSPMDPDSRTWLQHIFVSLILMLGCTGDQKKEIRYEDLFSFIQKKTEKGFITRLAFLGEAGVGKSTLFAKIALDWAMGNCLQDITLLFHESFRDIEDSPFFGDIVMNHFPDDTEIIGEWIDKYIKDNQRTVLILLDGLDEAKMDIKCPNRKLAIVSIARRERFIDTSVLINSRPFGADQIKSIPRIHEEYSYILVEGFTKENTKEYVKHYFKNETASASSLIHFMNTSSVVSEYMAPFPIFCCMLCYMWKVESKRKTIEKLQTISQLMKEMEFALREQYSSKYTDSERGYQCHMEKAVEAIRKVGRVAFEGLLKNQLIFIKEEMEACDEAAAVACHVGILSEKKRLASKEIRQQEGKQFVQEFCFPHKLLQEHTASLYLASLYNHNRSKFNRILTHKLLNDYNEFRYVLYFTLAHGGEVGKSVLEALCKKIDDIKFIIQCAFECHNSEAIGPVRNLLNTETYFSVSTSSLFSVPIAPFLFTLEAIGKEVVSFVRRSSSIRETLAVSESFEGNASSSDVAAAVGLFTLQNLRELVITNARLDDKFYTGMSAAASRSKIEKLTHCFADLGSAASCHYARGLCSMPNLRSLNMNFMELSDEFYSTMASEASRSKTRIL
ncbi:NACHT, LRR and PYD domains-containing protein 5-like [Strongylocentrotus purpuratus]|uniref:NACHT domain-containing protein n=1 Tax=Strongylocentrotus purpuratus TaxID=7668 RepID=A0A7M7NY02_STRPU|nr:NACHT, LRR and PYD domains-containing protein 5-like [Strongylocentrotus purpuratus]